MTRIFFESHATSTDNEREVASGWHDCDLTELGKTQAKELARRYEDLKLDYIFTSDLKRSVETANIAFASNQLVIIKDSRLRECNYGNLSGLPLKAFDAAKVEYIDNRFPGGESIAESVSRNIDFINNPPVDVTGKLILIIGHRSTRYALETLINHKELRELVKEKWNWKPALVYELD